MKIEKFQKKTPIVEAVQWDGTKEMALEITDWLREKDFGSKFFYEVNTEGIRHCSLKVITENGDHLVGPGQYVTFIDGFLDVSVIMDNYEQVTE